MIQKKEYVGALSDRLFDEEHMYAYIENYARENGKDQTLRMLSFAKEAHKGQVRKGKDQVPYIYHPLLIACHALALGLDEDDMLSAALLHDVCEDCHIAPENLPVNDAVRTAVMLLTKEDGYDKEAYYQRISENPIALMVKLLDRCNNVSGMAAGFSKNKMKEYICETEEYFYPMMQKAKELYPAYSNPLFLISYHMRSVIETIKRQEFEN